MRNGILGADRGLEWHLAVAPGVEVGEVTRRPYASLNLRWRLYQLNYRALGAPVHARLSGGPGPGAKRELHRPAVGSAILNRILRRLEHPEPSNHGDGKEA